ncbi:MAG: DUF6464 family protein [Geitlerinemataceae cyanobacterium]
MNAILQISLLAILAIAPSLWGAWQIRSTRRRFDRRWEAIRRRSFARSSAVPSHLPLGHANCQWSARSTHLRCAVNPHGPCTGCRDYTPIDPSW